MKAWVIKRDDGKYMDYSGRIDYEVATDYINEATFYDFMPNKKCLSSNEKVVSVTIVEGDIEAENEALKSRWEKLKKYIKTYQDDFTWKNKTLYEMQGDLIDKMQELEKEK